MKKLLFYTLICLSIPFYLNGQDTILDNYIRQGLESNLALKQKQLSYNKSLETLKEAKGLFFPNISFNARYTVAAGGRIIEFPVGDLLNPVYNTLNDLTSGLPPDQQFPDMSVENEDFYFYRPTEQETKLSLYQPIFNPDIYYNYKISKDYTTAGYLDVNIYKRELIAEIKTAYYNFLKTHYVLNLLNQTLSVVEENVRVNESLFKNDKVTVDVVDRSEAEYSKVEQQLAEAEKNNEIAAAYFNFLLNRPLNEEILLWDDPAVKTKEINIDKALNSALTNREEFKLIEAYTSASENFLKMNKMNKAPTLIAAVDYGIQGENYKLDNKSDYLLGSVVLKWELFAGHSNNAKIQQAKLEKQILREKQNELEKQINLEVIKAYYDILAAEKSIESARKQQESSGSAFNLINKKYNQGQANLIEFMDARNSMTNAKQNFIITIADYFVKYAELERVTGIYDLK